MNSVDVLTRGEVLESALRAREYLVTCGVPVALAAKDPRLWGRRAVEAGRLGWLDLPETSGKLLAQLDDLILQVPGSGRPWPDLDHIVLVAVGAESLAAQALARTAPRPLTVLDGTDSTVLDHALDRLDRTLVVIANKRGVSLEGDAYRRIFEKAFRDHGMPELEITGRFLVITDHGSPLDTFARECGYRIGLTDPHIPGHFGALSAYGVVPALLAGAEVRPLLEDAAAVLPGLSGSEDNPGLLLGSVLGGCATHARDGVVRDKIVVREPQGGSPLTGWITQLVATATSRQGRGILPLDPAGHPGPDACADLHDLTLNPLGTSIGDSDTSLWAPLGAQVLIWEYATAIAGWLLGVNPFEPAGQPAWEGEEDAATILRAVGQGPLPAGAPVFVDGDIEVYGDTRARDLRELLGSLIHQIPATGYLSIISYLSAESPGRSLAAMLARRSGRPVAYGAGPGYLQGTGAFHKLGPQSGAFLVLTCEPPVDRTIPGRPYSLGMLRRARALADVQSLRRWGLPVCRLHLRDAAAGASRLTQAVRDLN